MARKKITVAVTGLNAIDNPGPGIPVIRALRESKLYDTRIIGLSYENLEPGIFMHDLVDKTYMIPQPGMGTQALLSRLTQIHEKEKLDAIIPNFDSELFGFIKIRSQIKDLGIQTFLPDAEQLEAREKVNLQEFGKKNKLKVPESVTIHKTADLFGLPSNFKYPLVIKGKFYDASVVYNSDQAIQHFNRIASKWGTPLIVQKFIEGEEVNVTALGDGTGSLIGMVAMKKQYITDKGKAWSGISIDDDNLKTLTEKTIKATKWRGPMELEIIRSPADEYYLLEINPRFPAWIYLAVGCGQNHPEALLQLAFGEKIIPFQNYDVGKMFVRYSFDLIVDIKEFEKISTLGEL